MRIDQYLVQSHFFDSRSRAQDAIQEGRVFVNEKEIHKNSFDVCEDDIIRMEASDITLASRAGFKLLDVIEPFAIQLKNRICIDVGASTGGFSDVCLRLGARQVYAVDVGKDQLIERLRIDDRIINMEGVNCRYLQSDMFDPLPDFACMDVSFISVKKILPSLLACLTTKELVVLIKPQFEAGKQHIGKHGIVKDENVHIQVLSDMLSFVQSLGFYVHHVQASSLVGRDGNKEFVMHIKEEPCQSVFALKKIVKEYHVKR